jgi:hypothetical protein
MPQYEMKAPNGRTYRITGPVGATNAQVKAKILAQYPESGTRPKTSRTAAVISGIERGMKPVAEALDYLNPLAYIPNLFFNEDKARKEQQLGTQGARAKKDRPNYFTGGKIAGEVLATAPVGIGVGTGIRLFGTAFTKAAPKVAATLEKVGRATVTAGAGVRAPTKTAVASGQNVVAGRGKRMATRAVAGTLAAVPSAAITDNDMLEAAAAGSLVPVLGHMAKFGAGKTFDMLAGRLGEVEAARILRELVSSNADAITKALSNAPAKMKASTAEFLASKGLLTPEIAAVTIKATKGDFSGELLDVASERAAAQERVLNRLRGGETQTEAVSNIAATKKALQDVTGPQREEALTAADVGRTQIIPLEREAARLRQAASEEADNARRLLTANDRSANLIRESGLRLPADIKRQRKIVAGLERFGGEAADRSVAAGADARAAEAAAANLRAQGLQQLDISGLVSTLRQKASEAEFVSPDRFKILSEFANNLERRAAKMGGYIDATGLYLARREMSNFVSGILGTSDPKALRQGTAQLVGEAQPLIDDAIEAAGGKRWREYLDAFSGGMRSIERQDFQRALTALPPARFVKVMKGQDPEFVENILGPGRFDINAELQGPVLATAKKLASDIDAQQAVKATGLQDLPLSQRLGFAEGARTKVEGMIQPENVFTAGARLIGSIPKIGGGGVAAAQAAQRLIEKKSAGVMEKLVPALAQPSRARSLLETRSAEDYVNRLLYGANGSPVRQNVMAQTAVRPFNQPSDYEFPKFDPESGEPLVDIDFSEGYPVPIYGKLTRNMMRR